MPGLDNSSIRTSPKIIGWRHIPTPQGQPALHTHNRRVLGITGPRNITSGLTHVRPTSHRRRRAENRRQRNHHRRCRSLSTASGRPNAAYGRILLQQQLDESPEELGPAQPTTQNKVGKYVAFQLPKQSQKGESWRIGIS